MGYWIYTPEQGERIRAGEKSARDQFFEENYDKIRSTVKHFTRYYEPWKEELNGYINACYIDMHNWRFDKSDMAITDGLRKTLLKTRFSHREYELAQSHGISSLPVRYSLITEVDGKKDEFLPDLYVTDCIDVDSFDTLSPESIATFFLPFFNNKRYCDVLYLICCNYCITEACKQVRIDQKRAIKTIRKVFCDHYSDYLDFLNTHHGNSDLLLLYQTKTFDLSLELEERHRLELERRKVYRKKARERKNAQAV